MKTINYPVGKDNPLQVIGYNDLSKKAPTFREEMNCQRNDDMPAINKKTIPMGSGKSKPDKPPERDGGRWSKTFGSHEEGTVHEAGTSGALARRGCQFNEAFIVFPVEIFSGGPRAGKQYPRKIYLTDNGLIAAMNGETDIGREIENLVFIELCRGSELFTRFSVFYWREYGKSEGREVDFVIVKGGKVSELINVSYARSREEVKEREIIGLEMASRERKYTDKTIITWDYREDGGINYVPLLKWLLDR